MNNAQKINQLGQSIWYDNIERGILNDGSLAKMIFDNKIFGVTSNPSIFKNAIIGSTLYDNDISEMMAKGKNAFEIYDVLSITDIQAACDLFSDYYMKSDAKDGYVSLEVDPRLAYKTQETIFEAKRLWKAVNRPNLMIKIPATKEGVQAIAPVIAEGINVNVTLIFSVNRYKDVMDAFMTGLETVLLNDRKIDKIQSVASFFISRLDSKMDGWLNAKSEEGIESALGLKGKTAIANGKVAYLTYEKMVDSKRWKAIESQGGHMQRPLWASTSTKDLSYPDTLYIDELIANNTVNTIPPKTLNLYLDHGKTDISIKKDINSFTQALEKIEQIGLSLEKATKELEAEGVKSFADAFDVLLKSIESKM